MMSGYTAWPKSGKEYVMTKAPRKKMTKNVEPAADGIIQLNSINGIIQKGNKFFGRPFPSKMQVTSFEGRFLGFDKHSYGYVQPLDPLITKEFESMKTKMNEIYSRDGADGFTLHVLNVEMNELLVAQLNYDIFARVRVVAIRPEDKLLLVLDVDEEILHEVTDAQLYPMDNNFLRFPFMSIRYQLFALEHFLGTDVLGKVIGQVNGDARMEITIIKNLVIPIVLMVPVDRKKSLNVLLTKALSRFNPPLTNSPPAISKPDSERLISGDGSDFVIFQYKPLSPQQLTTSELPSPFNEE